MDNFLRFKEIVFSYNDQKIFDGLNLSVSQSEAHVILGESGCGKSTLLHILGGFITPQSGEIWLDGTCLFSSEKKINVLPEKRNVGIVFQDHSLFPHLTVEQNVAFSLSRSDKSRALEFLELVRLEDKANQYPDQLSGGQCQRVAIARTLASSPKVILLDEAFSSLDKQLRTQVRSEIYDLFKKKTLTSILVTHSQEEAFTLGDRLSVFSELNSIQTGTLDEILTNPKDASIANFIGAGIVFKGKSSSSFEFVAFEKVKFGEGEIEGKIESKVYEGKIPHFKITSEAKTYEPFIVAQSLLPNGSKIGDLIKFHF